MEEENVKTWKEKMIKKVKEFLFFNNIDSEAMSKLCDTTGNLNISSNTHQYKELLHIYDNFDSENYSHLQILRKNFVMKTKTHPLPEELDTNLKIIADLKAHLLNKRKISSGYVLNILTSTLTLMNSEVVNVDLLIVCLENLKLDFKIKDKELNDLPHSIVKIVEDNLLLLLNLIKTKVIPTATSEQKGLIILNFLDILRYFKSTVILIIILDVLKENQISIDIMNELFKELFIGKLEFANLLEAFLNKDGFSKKLDDSISQIELNLSGLLTECTVSCLFSHDYIYVFFRNFVYKLDIGLGRKFPLQFYGAKKLFEIEEKSQKNFNDVIYKSVYEKGLLYTVYYNREIQELKLFTIQQTH